MSGTVLINGKCDPAFKAVREALVQNLTDGEEIGEVVAVVVNGKIVVDLWGGYKDRARTRPWERDTLVCMFSVGKPVAVLAVLMLADWGRIDLDKPVAHFLSQSMTDDALTEQWQQTDALGLPCRTSTGFMLRNDALVPYNDNPRSFGHIGLGGALAFGDPDAKLGFSFCGNRMATVGLGPYVSRLIRATMSAL